MISLQHLYLRAFRSFRDEVEIDLPANGFVLVDGHNLDTGGSSGSGKTSIVEAVAFVLGYSKLPATELQNRQTKEKLQVRLTLSTPNGDIVISRGATNEIEIGGQKVTGAKNIQEGLLKIVGLPIELVEALTYRPQRSFGRFISMTDAEKKEFLTNCLPELQDLERVAEEARLRSEQLATQSAQSIAKISSLEAELERHRQNDPATTLKPIDCSELPALIQQAKVFTQIATTNYTEAQKACTEKSRAIKAERATLTSRAETEIVSATHDLTVQKQFAADNISSLKKTRMCLLAQSEDAVTKRHQQAQRLRDEQARLRTAHHNLLAMSSKRSSVVDAIAKLETEITSLRASICPTCQRTWLENSEKLAAKESEKITMKQKLVLINEATSRLPQLLNSINDLDSQINALPTNDIDKPREQAATYLVNIENEEGSIRALDGRIEQARRDALAKTQLESAQFETQLSELNRYLQTVTAAWQVQTAEERTLRDKLESATRYNTNIESQIALYRETVGRVLAMLDTERKTLVDLQTAIALELSVHQALGRQGYLGSIFDEILAEISTEVTDVLGNVPNVSGVTLRFDSTHETRKGATKRSIVPVVTKDGLEASFSSLSGGQQSSVELAVDLAIGNVIGRRTGRTPGWLILDESFDGLDVQAKEGCMAILKRYATNRLVCVIDHASELKELFDQHIQVQLHNGVSTVVS